MAGAIGYRRFPRNVLYNSAAVRPGLGRALAAIHLHGLYPATILVFDLEEGVKNTTSRKFRQPFRVAENIAVPYSPSSTLPDIRVPSNVPL